jgi:LysR family transcriptional activator of glutamate synthase operon
VLSCSRACPSTLGIDSLKGTHLMTHRGPVLAEAEAAVNLAQLEYFLAVARSRNFSRAAEDCYISQSSLSKQIKALEKELSVDLFVRSSAGVHLTPAGEMFSSFAGNTHRDYERVLLSLGRYSAGAHDRVRLGAVPLMEAYDLDSTLADFQIDNMDTQVDLFEREQANLLRRLEMDQVDVAIMITNNLSRDEYDWVALVRDEIVIVCSNHHPLARAHRISLGELKDERFVMLDVNSANHEIFCGECRKEGFFPNVIFMHTRHRPLLSAVKRGIGITALARGLTHTKDEAAFCCVPLERPFYMETGLVFRKDRELTPWAEKLVTFFARVYETPVVPAPDKG